MLTYLYLGALIFGGVLLGSSILLGGHDDADLDTADGDAALDKDVDVGGADFLFWLRSLRFYTFFLAFFGLTGLTLDGLGLVDNPIVTLVAALVMGLGTGIGASLAIRWLMKGEQKAAAVGADYVGRSAKVMVPVKKEGVGKVRVRVGGTHVDVLATTDEDDFAAKEEAIIISMDGTRARIARVEKE